MSEPLAVVLLELESAQVPGQQLAVRQWLTVPEAVVLPQQSSAAGQPAESSAAVAAAAGRSSVSAAAESLPGTPQGTEQELVAGLLDVLPETAQESGNK